ncbi:hypothetical protein HHK36_012446 [Tetracentron sinense]|uniref:PWWP domain-containing protein n=1 Tax=Tetracentron sinense TaxID=13715 RepID=A0A835DFQ8_TETSI|nr:hypothetical protein HHK36_012446 [Tetracentron sinense]
MISAINSGCELDRRSDVAADFPLFGVESPEQTRVSGDTLSEQRVDCSNGSFDGGYDGEKCLMTRLGFEETRVSSEFDLGELESKIEVEVSDGGVSGLRLCDGNDVSSVGNVEVEKRGSEEDRVFSKMDSREIDMKMEDRVSEVKDEDKPFSGTNDGFAAEDTGKENYTGTGGATMVPSGEMKGDAKVEERTVLDSDSLSSMFDESSAREMPEPLEEETSKASSYGFKTGDMVWGKVKSHPWWPGHIFNEAFASPSVRRTKREGDVLVAFFGDSSYGWFDPAELVHFEPHYAEKSRQINSRTFVKAVEEAVDEASRRRALGMTCHCRNPFNFRPTNVKDYFAVDLGGYEPGGVYSVKQIKNARDSFQPHETLIFIQKLALMPRNSVEQSIDWIKNMDTVLAYRKAVFEEFDETYAQAFGMQPLRPSRDSKGLLDQPPKIPPRAPLSGPLVIAEALGKKKSSTKPVKVKDQAKKDKYLFKRRDGPNDLTAHHISQGQANFSAPSTYKEGAAVLAAGDNVFQKRDPAVSMKPEVTEKHGGSGAVGREGAAALSGAGTGTEALTAGNKMEVAKFSLVDAQVNTSRVDSPGGFAVGFPITQSLAYSNTLAKKVGPGYQKPHMDKEMGALPEIKGRIGSAAAVGPLSSGVYGSDLLGKPESPGMIDGLEQAFQREGEVMVNSKHASEKLLNTFEGLQEPRFPTTVEDCHGPDQVRESIGGTPPLPIDAKLRGKVLGMGIDGAVKKAKIHKRPGEGSSSEKAITGEKKKKKKKKESGLETSLDLPHKRVKTAKDEESERKFAGKSIGIDLVSTGISQMDQQRKDNGASSTFPFDSVVTLPMFDVRNVEVELPQLVSDLLALALDPFHGMERNSPALVRQVFLRFRSLVYQKSLVLSPPAEAESSVDRATKSPASIEAAETPPIEDVRRLSSAPKAPKHPFRPTDPTKTGRKRSISERQEEMSAKRMKKLNEVKSLTSEKKAGSPKTTEAQRGDRKEVGVTAPAKPINPDSVKKPEPQARVAEPTMLVMKFPPQTTLPSIPELKARFARFGPLDHSATRVFWKSSTCRIVFKHKSQAVTAYNYAVRNHSLFGNVRVNYNLRILEVPASELPESGKLRAEDSSDELPQFRSLGASDSAGEPRPTSLLQRPLQSSVQLKSCLKKSSGDESGQAMGIAREIPRVKFMLGGDESSRDEQLVISSSNIINNNGSNADVDASSSLAMDVNSKNIQKLNLLPLLPLPPRGGVAHFPEAHHVHYSNVEPRNDHNINTSTNKIDISYKMLTLLVRCSDIVTDVKCSFGYVPYQPL